MLTTNSRRFIVDVCKDRSDFATFFTAVFVVRHDYRPLALAP